MFYYYVNKSVKVYLNLKVLLSLTIKSLTIIILSNCDMVNLK